MYGNGVESASCPFPLIFLLSNHHHLISHQKNSEDNISSFHIWHQDEMPADIIISLLIKVPSAKKHFYPLHLTSRFFSTIVISLRETCHQSSFSRKKTIPSSTFHIKMKRLLSHHHHHLLVKALSADRHLYLQHLTSRWNAFFQSSSSSFLSKFLWQLNISIFNICHQDAMP